MGHVVDKVHEDPHVGANIKDFPGGLHDTSVLMSYADHVAARV